VLLACLSRINAFITATEFNSRRRTPCDRAATRTDICTRYCCYHAQASGGGAASRSGAIAEVALDEGSGLWVYMGLRPDKDRPNFITTVMSTLVELAEGISQEELQYRMGVTDPAEDEWSKHFGKMQKQLVGWQADAQRKKVAAAAASSSAHHHHRRAGTT
jgi:mRNA capping enzyme, C-terminal domain